MILRDWRIKFRTWRGNKRTNRSLKIID